MRRRNLVTSHLALLVYPPPSLSSYSHIILQTFKWLNPRALFLTVWFERSTGHPLRPERPAQKGLVSASSLLTDELMVEEI